MANRSLIVCYSGTQKIDQGSNTKKKEDIFWEYEEAKNKHQLFNLNRRLNLLRQPHLQQPFYTEMLRNSSFTNAANFDIDTL